ncbi:serine--tRNA ligase [Flectobacillus sp. BAB-3569]|uniref:serine--tRNA ligase n=1 Tax=Flectobacillus sp. BAB-3569 TaxID=1509483 RepID=UPI000BA38C03|nr:serine--tRNA ligase [Flectobacillus sp. BAB-3569]NBA76099.1 serine--tRNA ligase [Emticicia sp. ODNR4P]PAC32495.1 serine--tRNA ligase [Flectobacillus sp. BAB-3569]
MLQIQQIKENKEATIAGLKKKHFKNAEEAVEQIIALDDKRRETQNELDSTLAKSNALAKEIGGLMKAGKKEEAEAAKAETSTLKARSKELDETLKSIESELYEVQVTLPNLPHSSVPEGKTPEENEVILENGSIPTLAEDALAHWDLIKKYDIIDFELGNKITGAGFPVYKGKGARIQRALINFFLDEAIAAGYAEVQPPILINKDSGFGTGQLPDKDGQMYHATVDDLYLIPTAEVPITNLYRDVILQEGELPVKNAGYTPCFRREAGSWGAHVRGLNRLHQFDKVEIVRIEKPENSYAALEEMSLHVQGLLQKLELPYRVLRLCGGDMSFTSALTYDMEVFSGAQKRWLEVSSVSNFETYQANRLKLRMKTEGKSQLLHTLNGSALALPRILAAILENNQTPEGIRIPKALVPYCGFEMIA